MAIALLWIIVDGVDDDHGVRNSGEQIGRQLRTFLLRNSHDDDVATARRFSHGHGCRASLLRQSCESLGTSRVSYENLMAERGEAPSERAADVARANDANIHLRSFVGYCRR